ncbi:MAG: leucine-rich repeat domain-containing protein, partial [Clostridia bacterium]|nr:leucine-rich repeat domain-containing protein [Clostridia bacterium]
SIGARAFASCGVLRSVDIPASVTSIGEAAFERCYALEAACLPAGLTQIGARAFRYCSALTLYVPSGSPAHDYAKANGLTVKTIG